MADVESSSVALVVTSPPYFAGKEYEQALGEGHIPASYLDYLTMLRDVFAECVRVLEPGGRIAVNVANLGRRPYRSLAGDVTMILQDELGLLLRGEVVWVKADGASGSTAWGSFQSAANPVLRDLSERIVVASKGRFDRAPTRAEREARGLPVREHDLQAGVHGRHARRLADPARERPPGRAPGAVPGRDPGRAASSSSPSATTSCSTRSWARARLRSRRFAPTAGTSATTPTRPTSRWPRSGSPRPRSSSMSGSEAGPEGVPGQTSP